MLASNKKPPDKDADRGNARRKELSVLNGQGGENKHIEQIGEEHVPFEDRDDAQARRKNREQKRNDG